MNTIYFFASFGNMNELPKGGGQTAARRLSLMLEEMGNRVVRFNRHKYYYNSKIVDNVSKMFFALADPILFFFFLLIRRRKHCATMYMGYTGSILGFDHLITLVTYILGFRNIMYLAGGKAKSSYENGSTLYRWLFRKTMSMYDEVMVEGEVNVELVQQCTNKTKVYYLPNFTENGFAPNHYPQRKYDKIGIFYFGRIDEHKNILLSIDVFNKLCKTHDNVFLTIVGGGSPDYETKVNNAIETSPFKHRIHHEGRVSHERICELMKSQHFFIFPSSNPCEGHSNALNEAMAWGLIPIVSNLNFLPKIVGNDLLVVDSYNVEDYVSVISRLIDDDDMETISKQMFQRVQSRFVQEIVQKNLCNELDAFFNNNGL